MPLVLYILARHAHSAEEVITRAVNDTVDNNSAGAIVGAAVGALHGIGGLPDKWIEELTGRNYDSDDGQVFKLILLAKKNSCRFLARIDNLTEHPLLTRAYAFCAYRCLDVSCHQCRLWRL